MKKCLLLFISLISIIYHTHSQEKYNYYSPLDIPLLLSANFGELRANHFHTGLDFKTLGVINKNVFSIEDGYISRIGINAGGYGLTLYITHPNGQTSVYAHLNSFSSRIAQLVKKEQYSRESYTLNIRDINPKLLPVKKGELIAKSGNTGSSAGPHVHFELRDTKTQNAIDPLPYYLNSINDNIAPLIRGIAITPLEEAGVINNSNAMLRQKITILKDGTLSPINRKIEAWGKIGISIHAIDKMNKTNNIYGIKEVRLYKDNHKIFSSNINSIDFSTTRMINSFTDFNYWKESKHFFMKSYIEPGNRLHIYPQEIQYIDLQEERIYNFKYELEDVHGNISSYNFSIEGKKQEIPKVEPCSLVMKWNENNRYLSEHFRLIIPKNYLYANVDFLLERKSSNQYYSDIYQVHHQAVPLHNFVNMSLKLQHDSIENKTQYGIISIKKGKNNWIGGVLEGDFITARIRELGDTYAILADTDNPTVIPIKRDNWIKNKKIIIKADDDLSGVSVFRGTIDGEYALFEHDIKSPNYTYHFDDTRIIKGKTHLLEVIIKDGVGNESSYKTEFHY